LFFKPEYAIGILESVEAWRWKVYHMNNRGLRSWAGLLSIFWILGGYALLRSDVSIGHLAFLLPTWLFLLGSLFLWLGVGLMLAIAGLRGGNVTGRVCGFIGLAVFLYFTWLMLAPRLSATHHNAGMVGSMLATPRPSYPRLLAAPYGRFPTTATSRD
jgi:hypothetical protein